LTGLYNRSEFEYQLKFLLYQIKLTSASHTLFHLNLDQFKQVNAHYGNIVGDLLLKQWVLFLKERVRAGDIFARLEGDNFAVLLKNCAIEHAKTVASHFIKATQEFELSVDHQRIKISVSIGAVPIHTCSENFMQILNSAELACCAAKEQGGNQVYVHQNHFTPPQR
jgi:diguanylate cyclase (GGDEF)-like protein